MWVNLLSYALSGVILYVNFWIKGLENVLVMLKKRKKKLHGRQPSYQTVPNGNFKCAYIYKNKILADISVLFNRVEDPNCNK